MTNKHREAAKREDAIQQIRLQWMRERVVQIHQRVTIFDVLTRNGIDLKCSGEEEQFSCPFHGVDRRPSARVYPEGPSGPSHAWCFKCQERWDAIELWKKFNGEESFGRALTQIERAFGLNPPELSESSPLAVEDREAFEEFELLREACEKRLRGVKEAYANLGDMRGFLTASSLLDRVSYRVMREESLSPDKGLVVLRKLLDRIGQKVRSVAEGGHGSSSNHSKP